MKLKKFFGHLNTVNKHRFLVFKYSVKAGIPFRGLVHDLSKYSLLEFLEGVKYYNGNFSPISTCKKVNGYSKAWLHHKGRNKHHFEYWMDYSNVTHRNDPVEMPYNYVVEMFCDRVAASMIYQKEKYTDSSALEYYENGRGKILIHPETDALIHHLLKYLSEHGLDQTIHYIVTEIKE